MIRRVHPLSKTVRAVKLLLCAGAVAAVWASATAVAPVASTSTNHVPIGALSWVHQSPDGAVVHGWAYDADTTAALSVRITVDGKLATTLTANLYGTGLSQYGSYHFFQTDLPEPAGTHTFCAFALDVPTKTAHQIACKSFAVNFSPVGTLSSVTAVASGTMRVYGWALDPNVPKQALTTHITVDGVARATVTANAWRSDVARVYPDAGGNHGVDVRESITEGKHTICLSADNVGAGSSRSLGCKTTTFNFSPVGAISGISQRPGGFRITGWAKDPDTSAPITVQIRSGSTTLGSVTANADTNAGHGFDATVKFPGPTAPGVRQICVVGLNATGTVGHNVTVACVSHSFNFNPSAGIDSAKQQSPGIRVVGWATDPNTTSAIKARITLDGTLVSTFTASLTSGSSHPGHGFTTIVRAPNGTHTVCVVGLKATVYSTADSPPACATVTLNFNPTGKFESAARVGTTNAFVVKGYAKDPDTSAAINVSISSDGKTVKTATANVSRTDVGAHGFSVSVGTDAFEHKVCVTAINVLGGTGNTSLGCKIVIAAHPTPPSAPQQVTATAGYGGAVINWVKPASDGGAPWSGYTITSSPDGISVKAGPNDTSATVLGLKPSTTYTFTVVATNVAGTSAPGTSNATKTLAAPPPQTTPAPISTSRYVRNISGATTTDITKMHSEGATDAYYNPSGHAYLVLLDIGGQDETRGGVILSASTGFVTYAALVKNIESYVDGYASKQRASAPVTIAIGTNNDVDVSKTSGINWANKVVDPVMVYARKYPNVVIAGADDIEPGFSATYTETKAWLSGYLSATTAPFVFNGSADGCSWTTTGQRCNNGWTMAGLFGLAGGMSPTKIVNLPQIYNTTMAKQWRYISLTGVLAGAPRLNFGGALTEWTACQQDGGCGSLTGNTAWTTMWNQLRAEPKLFITSLPYSTDLRIDK